MILTDERGVPIPRPLRSDFTSDLDGSIAFLDAFYAHRDRVASVANAAFADGFVSELRRHRKEK